MEVNPQAIPYLCAIKDETGKTVGIVISKPDWMPLFLEKETPND